MREIKVWPHLVIVAVVCAVLAGVGVALWMKHEQTASAEALPNAARIQRVEGEVALNNSNAGNTESDDWIRATENQPVSVGDRIYTRDNSRTGLAFTGRNFARLNPNTSLDVLSLEDRRTQLALRDGSAVFDVGYLNSGDLFEVATPYGAVDFQQPGLYNVGIDNGQVLVSVLSGLAQVVGLGGSGQISKGELLTLVGNTAANAVLSQIDGRDAGSLVDNYYAYQYPRYYDGRYRDYNAYLNDPYYFDPYRRTVSYQYANSYIPGLYDLDYYGDWNNVQGYGNCWAPRVDAGWTPYQSGYWYTDYPYGPTWVSSEPWGYAPYHYGRWAFVGNRWYWVPDRTNVEPVYSPALVAFVPFDQNQIGWVPLGPGDVYVPHYYNTTWQPQYLTRDNLYPRVANLNVPGAVTVVSVDDFTRGHDWRQARKADRNMLTSVKPVLDPLLITPLRHAVVNSAWGRGKVEIPPGIAKKLNDTTVVTSTTPPSPAFRPDLAKRMRVNDAPDHAKGQKFQVRDERKERGGPPQQVSQAPVQPPQQQQQRRQQQPVEPQRNRGQEQREARRAEQPQPRPQPQQAQQRPQQPRGQQKQVERRQQQAQGERVAAPARPAPARPAPARPAPAPRAQPQPQPKHERPPQAQQQQPRGQQKQQQQKPQKQEGGNPGKGKGKKP